MQVGSLVYDDHYGLGIVIAIEDGFHTVEFPEVGSIGITGVSIAGERLEVICK